MSKIIPFRLLNVQYIILFNHSYIQLVQNNHILSRQDLDFANRFSSRHASFSLSTFLSDFRIPSPPCITAEGSQVTRYDDGGIPLVPRKDPRVVRQRGRSIYCELLPSLTPLEKGLIFAHAIDRRRRLSHCCLNIIFYNHTFNRYNIRSLHYPFKKQS